MFLSILIFCLFLPAIAYGSLASDFTVNRQSTYAVPFGTIKMLILDLTLPTPAENETQQLQSIKIHNTGTADHTVISKLMIWEDGSSVGWNNDEIEVAKILTVPFFDTEITGTFREYSKEDPWQRIFVTLDISSTATAQKTIRPQLLENAVVFFDATCIGPTDASVTGFERSIVYGASVPIIPVVPLAKYGEALSASTIRWHFTDLSNNEFGFKILDSELNTVASKNEANLSYLDETGLSPGTKYSGRSVMTFNDRGESLGSGTAVFEAVWTLTQETKEEVTETEEEVEQIEEIEDVAEVVEELSLIETLQAKIIEIQVKINQLLDQLMELIQQQTATIWTAFLQFLQSFFGK